MGNVVVRFGAVPDTFEEVFARRDPHAAKPKYQRPARWRPPGPVAPRDYSNAMHAVAELRRRRPQAHEADVRAKLWELRGQWEQEFQPIPGKDNKSLTQLVRSEAKRRLYVLEHGGVPENIKPYIKAGLSAEAIGMFMLMAPAEIAALRTRLYGAPDATARPRQAPPMPDFYHARVADLLAAGVPADLIPALVRGIGVPLRGPRRNHHDRLT
jgi:hypothetical protein